MLLVFSLIFTVVSRLLLLYNTVDKTSRLKMKCFSTVRDTQRGSQSYMVKREVGVRGDSNEIRWNQKHVGSPKTRDQNCPLHWQADSLPAELPGKPEMNSYLHGKSSRRKYIKNVSD